MEVMMSFIGTSFMVVFVSRDSSFSTCCWVVIPDYIVYCINLWATWRNGWMTTQLQFVIMSMRRWWCVGSTWWYSAGNEDDYETTRRRPFSSVSLSFMFSGISDNKPSINYPMCRAYVQLAAITLIWMLSEYIIQFITSSALSGMKVQQFPDY